MVITQETTQPLATLHRLLTTRLRDPTEQQDVQGNRVKNSSCDETCEEVVVPSGDFAFESEAIFAGGFSDQIEGHVSQRGEIGGGVVGADTAFVVAEDHVHHPV